MEARMKNPAMILPAAMKPIQDLMQSCYTGGVPETTLELVHLRVSQINGCSACVHAGARQARKAGETEDRIATVAAWREAPFSPTPSARRWRWPRRPPGWPTGRTRCRTRSGTTRLTTTTRRDWPRWS